MHELFQETGDMLPYADRSHWFLRDYMNETTLITGCMLTWWLHIGGLPWARSGAVSTWVHLPPPNLTPGWRHQSLSRLSRTCCTSSGNEHSLWQARSSERKGLSMKARKTKWRKHRSIFDQLQPFSTRACSQQSHMFYFVDFNALLII